MHVLLGSLLLYCMLSFVNSCRHLCTLELLVVSVTMLHCYLFVREILSIIYRVKKFCILPLTFLIFWRGS